MCRAGKITNANYQKLFSIARRTATRDLTGLVEKGILRSNEAKGGSFIKYWQKSENQNCDIKFNDTGIFSYYVLCFNIDLKEGLYSINWTDIERFEAYKADSLTIDEICIEQSSIPPANTNTLTSDASWNDITTGCIAMRCYLL